MRRLEKTLAVVQMLLAIEYIGLIVFKPLSAGHPAVVFILFIGLIASLIGTDDKLLPLLWGVLFLAEFIQFFMEVLK